jgi:hypothetical protein
LISIPLTSFPKGFLPAQRDHHNLKNAIIFTRQIQFERFCLWFAWSSFGAIWIGPAHAQLELGGVFRIQQPVTFFLQMSDIGKTIWADRGGILASVRARMRVPEAAGVLHCTGGSRCESLYSSRRGLWARPGIFFQLHFKI